MDFFAGASNGFSRSETGDGSRQTVSLDKPTWIAEGNDGTIHVLVTKVKGSCLRVVRSAWEGVEHTDIGT